MIKGIDSLAALMEEADKAGQNIGLAEIDLDSIGRDPTQPRRSFPDETLRDLAESIKAQGVIQPIVLRADPEQAGRYVLIAGERRWRASRIAGLDSIPAVVREASDETVLALQLVENLNREDVSIMEEAEAVARLSDMLGKATSVAKALGKTKSWVSQRCKIAKGLYLVQPVVDSGATRDPETLTMLIDLAKSDEAVYDGFLHQTRISRGEVRSALERAKGKQAAPETPPEVAVPTPPPEAGDEKKVSHVKLLATEPAGKVENGKKVSHVKKDRPEDLAKLEAELSQRLGQAVTIALTGEGRGDLRVRFETLAQLDDILSHIH